MTPQEREARLAQLQKWLCSRPSGECRECDSAEFLLEEIERVRVEARAEALEEATELIDFEIHVDGEPMYNEGLFHATQICRALAAPKPDLDVCSAFNGTYDECKLQHGHGGYHEGKRSVWTRNDVSHE